MLSRLSAHADKTDNVQLATWLQAASRTPRPAQRLATQPPRLAGPTSKTAVTACPALPFPAPAPELAAPRKDLSAQHAQIVPHVRVLSSILRDTDPSDFRASKPILLDEFSNL